MLVCIGRHAANVKIGEDNETMHPHRHCHIHACKYFCTAILPTSSILFVATLCEDFAHLVVPSFGGLCIYEIQQVEDTISTM